MTLTEIKKLSPVKIYYRSVYGNGEYHPLEKCILIDKDLRGAVKMGCLLHEIGHAIHHAEGCRCMTLSNHTLAEYHAMRFVMKHIKDNPVLIRVFIDKTIFLLVKGDSEYRTAAERIMKLKQWKEFCKII